jgi:hypothetical protein
MAAEPLLYISLEREDSGLEEAGAWVVGSEGGG